jgi:DNA-binding transcriptional regulator YiaG
MRSIRLDPVSIGHHKQNMTNLPTMTPEELRAIREELGLKQYEAPPLFGVALNTYKRWELGTRSMPGPAVLLAQLYLKDHRKLKR